MPGKPCQVGPYGSLRRAHMQGGSDKQQPHDGRHRRGGVNDHRGGNNADERDADGVSLGEQYGHRYGDDVQEITVKPGQMVRLVETPSEDDTEDDPEPPRKGHPQERITKFWNNFDPEYEGGVVQILPEPLASTGLVSSQTETTVRAVTSYTQARDQCIKSVKKIVRECRSLNQKYTDPHFDIEHDLKVAGWRNCLDSLTNPDDIYYQPEDVKRVTDIFKDPQFYKDGASFDDVVQGLMGDCWLLAALSALTSNEELLRRVCVVQDQEVGVYGFVFYRDGEWQPCIIDDKLYLRAPSYEESDETILTKYYVRQKDEERRYKKVFQTGSKALYFAGCRDENETWVPLLEKAFAKAHGDYAAISGGQTGEALEDLTGGVTTEFYTTNIISKDTFWKENLSRTGKEYLFSCAMASYTNWRLPTSEDDNTDRVREARKKGIQDQHAYAILATYEGCGQRLVKIRNPWGHKEWAGAWSDGSKEWTTEWVNRLEHKFGDDGVFWMSYEDLLRKYKFMDRTRIFGPEWHVAQQWTGVQVPWNTRDYQQTKFTLKIPKDSETVIVLSQLDDRYFKGFQGKYIYKLHFRIQNDSEPDEDDYIARSPVRYDHWRSTNVEISLEAGNYTILIKVEAFETGADDIETVIRSNYRNKNKITKIATLYDLAHAKGRLPKKEPSSNPEAKEEQPPAPEGDKKADDKPKAEPGKEEPKNVDDPKKEAPPAPIEDGKPLPVPEPTEPGAEPRLPVEQSNSNSAPAPGASPNPIEQAIQGPDPAPDPAPVPVPPPEIVDPCRTPFNAFCTVGLRVYSKIPDLQLQVVLPSEERKTALDRDDIAKAALDEVTAGVATADAKKDVAIRGRGKVEAKNESDDSSSSEDSD